MTELTVIKELLCDELFCGIGEQHGRSFVRLKETDPSAKLRRIDLMDVPKGSMVVNLDKSKPPNSLFREELGKRRRCDYVIITQKGGKRILIFIEIKSATKVHEGLVKQQFRGAECVIDYCDATLSRFHGKASFLAQFEKRFVVFYRPHLAKKKTRPTRTRASTRHESGGKNTTPEKMLKYRTPINPSMNALI